MSKDLRPNRTQLRKFMCLADAKYDPITCVQLRRFMKRPNGPVIPNGTEDLIALSSEEFTSNYDILSHLSCDDTGHLTMAGQINGKWTIRTRGKDVVPEIAELASGMDVSVTDLHVLGITDDDKPIYLVEMLHNDPLNGGRSFSHLYVDKTQVVHQPWGVTVMPDGCVFYNVRTFRSKEQEVRRVRLADGECELLHKTIIPNVIGDLFDGFVQDGDILFGWRYSKDGDLCLYNVATDKKLCEIPQRWPRYFVAGRDGMFYVQDDKRGNTARLLKVEYRNGIFWDFQVKELGTTRFQGLLQDLQDGRWAYVGTPPHLQSGTCSCYVFEGQITQQPVFDLVTHIFYEGGAAYYYGLTGRYILKMRVPVS